MVALIAASSFLHGGCGPSRRDLEEQAASQSELAGKEFNDRHYSRALDATRTALGLNSDLRNDSAFADNSLLLASCQRQLGDYDSALVSFESTIEYFHSLNDQHLERRARIALSDFYHAMHKDADAVTIASAAATSAKVFSDVGDMYRALKIVARSNHRLGRYDDEMETLADLARIDSQSYQGRERPLLLRWMMQAFDGKGDQAGADGMFNRWKELAASARDSAGLGEAYYYRGLSMRSRGLADSASKAFSRALGQAGRRHDVFLQANILGALGNLAYRAQQYEDARRHYADALEAASKTPSFVLKSMLGLALIACDSKQGGGGQGGSSADLAKRCIAAAGESRQNSFAPGEALANFMAGRLLERGGDPGAALSYYRAAADRSEQCPEVSEPGPLDFIGVYLRGEDAGWYDPLIRLYCASGQADSAFAAVERKNLNELSDFYSRISFRTSDRNLNKAIAAVQWNMNALRLLGEDVLDELGGDYRREPERFAALKAAYPDRVSKMARSVSELVSADHNFHWLLHPDRLRLSAIRDTLDRGSALVEYAAGGDTLFALVVTDRGGVVRKAAVSRKSLLPIIREYNKLVGDIRLNPNGTWINDGSTQGRLNGLSTVLGKILLSPVMQDISGADKLYAALPEEFGWLPFHTLRWEDRPLASRMNVSYVPTAAALLFSSPRERPVRRVLGVGYRGGTTWDVEYEIKDIRGFYESSRMLFDTIATLNHMMDSAYDVVHIAAEFQFERDVPDNSHLLLADGITPFGVREVSIGELLGVPRPQTIVLSNISSRVGGLSRYAPLAFLANGTKTVFGSGWQVDRKSKKYFGEGLYTALLGGVSASDAYKHAIESLLRQGEFSALQRWGAYYQYGR
jgi:tetratricopeptide (TPR) repeat protein